MAEVMGDARRPTGRNLPGWALPRRARPGQPGTDSEPGGYGPGAAQVAAGPAAATVRGMVVRH